MIELLNCGAADNVTSECFEQWLKSDKLMVSIVRQLVSTPLFIRPMGGFIKQHVDSTIKKYLLMQLYNESGKSVKTRASLPPSRLASDAAEKSKNTSKPKDSKR